MKYFIVSQPKSGTHLMTNIYRNLGLDGGYILFNQHGITMQIYRDTYFSLQLDFEFKDSCQLILDNKFGYGHIPFSNQNLQSLSGFNIVYLTRSFDDCLESSKRFLAETGEEIIVSKQRFDSIHEWSNVDGVLTISYEDLISKNYAVIDNLQAHLFESIQKDSKLVLDTSLLQPSKTKSTLRK